MYISDDVSRDEYNQVVRENEDLRDDIWRAKDLVRDALYSSDLERCKSILYEVEKILERA